MERVRQRGELKSNSAELGYWHLFNGCTPTVFTQMSSGPGPFVGSKQVMYDTVIPKFRERVAAGEVFFNPMYSETIDVSSSGGNGHHVKSKAPSCGSPLAYHEYKVTGDVFGRFICNTSNGPSFSHLVSEDDLQRARVEVSTSCQNARGRSDSNLYESLAEAGKSAKLLQGLGRRAVRTVTSLKAASAEWLAYRYGLTPIIRDTEAVLKGLRKQVGHMRKTSRAFLSLSSEDYAVSSRNADYVTDFYNIQFKDEVELRAMSLDEYVADFGSNIGFTGKGFLTLPWELTSHSFVADWFLNVGDYLGAMSPAFGYNQLGSCLVEKRILTNTYHTAGTVEQTGTYAVISPWAGSVVASRTSKRRSGLMAPSIVVRSDFGFGNFKRGADAFALAAQILLRRA